MLVPKRKFILLLRSSVILCVVLLFSQNCRQNTKSSPIPNNEMPNKILWAWERAEDLRFLDANKFGVAFLAQTITLKNDGVTLNPRRQSLQIASEYLSDRRDAHRNR